MDQFFKLKANGTNVRTEVIAGLTTFMTMAYVLAVNPSILSTGPNMMGWNAVFLATAIAAGVMTIAMGLFVNFPVALAPGMGLNAYFAAVVLSGAYTWQMALTAVFISGIIFILLTITQLRQMLLVAVPDSLRHAITVGIGLFITILGLKNSGLLTISVDTISDVPAGTYTDLFSFESIFHMGSLENVDVQLAIVGLVVTSVLMVLRIKGAILYGILATTLVAVLMGSVDFKTLGESTWIPQFSDMNIGAFDWKGIMNTGIISVVATFTFVELFDTFGTLAGTATRAGFMKNKEEGKKKVGKAMFVDAIGVSGGALVGTSTVTAYIESASGIAEGGRTGLTSVTTGVLFLAAIFIAPLVALVPGSAASAALIVVGVLMMQSIKEIDFQDFVVAIPAFLTIVFMPFTYNIANGISFGIFTYVLLATVGKLSGKSQHKVHWLMWILFILIIARYVFIGSD